MASGRFEGRGAIVTGGAGGIGGATARRLGSEGAKVLIVDIVKEAAEANAERIRKAGGKAVTMTGNVADEKVSKAMVERAMSEFGRLDIMVQNAYGGGRDRAGSAVDVTPKAWHEGMDLLVGALYLGAKYGVPAMDESGAAPGFEAPAWKGHGLRHGEPPKMNVGRIINISSVHGVLQAPKSLIYEAGKAAVIGLTRQMAVDFGPLGITVNAIAPGHIVTERSGETWAETSNEKGFHLFELQYPVRRTGAPDDIANAIAFLCSDEASFITGVLLPVDGGLTIQLQENIVMDIKDYIVKNPDLRTYFDRPGHGAPRW
jgi:NAD(P)-dependent dehydrogenase (short-subunit alcohol dehydrogenase family)